MSLTINFYTGVFHKKIYLNRVFKRGQCQKERNTDGEINFIFRKQENF